ncbi:hypothetical protein Tco_0371930, partial [Tanacetum coccineum]
EDASKQGRKIEELDAEAEYFGELWVLNYKSLPVRLAEVVTTSSASVVIPNELTLAQTLIEIKTAKPKHVTTAAITVTSVRPRANNVKTVRQEQSESSTEQGELKSDMSKKQKIDKHVEFEKDDQEEAEMKRHIEIVKDDEVAIDVIPLATKPPVIVEHQIDKNGRMRYFKLIRADGSSKRYSSMIKMLQGIDKEDLETLWKLVKA